MDGILIISMIGISLLIILLLAVYLYRKNMRSTNRSLFRKSNVPEPEKNFVYMTCPRCKQNNYVNEHNHIKLCNSCGWNLTEPYINQKCTLVLNQEIEQNEIFDNIKVNERVFLRRDPFNEDNRESIAVYNSQYEKIGWVPNDVAKEIIPKIEMSSKIFAVITKIHKHSRIEVLITNDVQKLWGHSAS